MAEPLTATTAHRGAGAASVKRARSVDIYAPQWRNFLFVAPYLVFFVTLLVVPLFWGIWLSFHKADTFSSGPFIGFGNYVRLFNDKIFLQSIWNTFYFVLLTVPSLALLGLFLALCLNRRTRSAAVLRGLFFSSSVLSRHHRHSDLAYRLHSRYRPFVDDLWSVRCQGTGLPVGPEPCHDRHRHRHRLVVHRPADDAVSLGTSTDPAGYL